MFARMRACEGFLKRNLHLHRGRRKALSAGHSGGRGGSFFLHLTFTFTFTSSSWGTAPPKELTTFLQSAIGLVQSGIAPAQSSIAPAETLTVFWKTLTVFWKTLTVLAKTLTVFWRAGCVKVR